jgi:hypothetical protein
LQHRTSDACSAATARAPIDGIERFYPIDNFPALWNRIDELIKTGRLHVSEEEWNEAVSVDSAVISGEINGGPARPKIPYVCSQRQVQHGRLLLADHGAADPLYDPVRLVLADLVQLVVSVPSLVRVQQWAACPLQVVPELLIALAAIVFDAA